MEVVSAIAPEYALQLDDERTANGDPDSKDRAGKEERIVEIVRIKIDKGECARSVLMPFVRKLGYNVNFKRSKNKKNLIFREVTKFLIREREREKFFPRCRRELI